MAGPVDLTDESRGQEALGAPRDRVLSVGELLAGLRGLLEQRVGRQWVTGEVSNLHRAHRSVIATGGPNGNDALATTSLHRELVNIGAVKHEFTAESFFASVAWRKAESAESEIKANPHLEIEKAPAKKKSAAKKKSKAKG